MQQLIDDVVSGGAVVVGKGNDVKIRGLIRVPIALEPSAGCAAH